MHLLRPSRRPHRLALYRPQRDRDAVRDRADGMVDLRPAAGKTFAALGVDRATVDPARQRLAIEWLDATEAAPHLAGALGDAFAHALISRRWIDREPNSRTIHLTQKGARELQRTVGLDALP
jgi:hypothetical protein